MHNIVSIDDAYLAVPMSCHVPCLRFTDHPIRISSFVKVLTLNLQIFGSTRHLHISNCLDFFHASST